MAKDSIARTQTSLKSENYPLKKHKCTTVNYPFHIYNKPNYRALSTWNIPVAANSSNSQQHISKLQHRPISKFHHRNCTMTPHQFTLRSLLSPSLLLPAQTCHSPPSQSHPSLLQWLRRRRSRTGRPIVVSARTAAPSWRSWVVGDQSSSSPWSVARWRRKDCLER